MNPIPSHCGALRGGFFFGGSFQPGKLLPEGSILAQQFLFFS